MLEIAMGMLYESRLCFKDTLLTSRRFRKQTQYVTLAEYEEWSSRYEETLERRRRKWEVLLRESGLSYGEGGPVRFPPKSAKVKRYIRKGIPPEWRGAAWFWYAGGQKVMSKHAGLYEELVKRGLDSPDSELIERGAYYHSVDFRLSLSNVVRSSSNFPGQH